jgi:acetyl esterase
MSQEAPMQHEAQMQHEAVDYAVDPHLSKSVREFLKPLNAGGPPLESLSKEDARAALVAAQAAVKVDLSGIEEAQRTITCDGYTIVLNIVRPKGSTGVLPVFIFIHGGGWVLGDYPTHKRMVRDLVILTGFAGVFVNYTPSPEAQYPEPLREIHAAAKWLVAHGEEILVDSSKMGIVGNSVGGNMTAAVSLMAKANGGPNFKAQVMMWPVTNADFTTKSWKRFGKQRFLTASLMQWMWDQYTTDPAKRKEIYASPLQANAEQLKGLPPTLIQVAENDILRDEGEAFGRALDEAGVDSTTVQYKGVIHDFGLLNGLATIPQTRSLFLHAAAHLKKYLVTVFVAALVAAASLAFTATSARAQTQAVDYATDPHLTVGVKAFLKLVNQGPAIETLSKEDARLALVNAQKSVNVDLSGITVSEKTITAGGYTIKLNIVRPKGAGGVLPVFLYIHGGGWILGDFPTHERMVRDLVVLSGCAAVFINYTPSPEAQYPQAINEIYAAANWVSQNGKEIGVDGSNMAVAGNSVGGDMSAVLCLMCKDKNGPKLKAQILMWPLVDANFETESYKLYGAQRFLTEPLMRWMFDQYTKDPAQRQEPYCSPLNASIEQLSGLPPALIQIGENDILRDAAEAYGRKLDAAGVKVTTVRYDGMIHDFGLLNGLAQEPAVRSLFVQAAAELRRYLKPM